MDTGVFSVGIIGTFVSILLIIAGAYSFKDDTTGSIPYLIVMSLFLSISLACVVYQLYYYCKKKCQYNPIDNTNPINDDSDIV